MVYGLGDFACNIYWQSVSLFLLFYYTDRLGLAPVTAGLIFLVASVWDGLIDPLIGLMADRVRAKLGGYRLFLLFGGPLLGLSFVGLYYRPPFEGVALAAFVLLTHLIFRTFYALVNVPYGALTARITTDPARRAHLSGFRMFFGALAAALVPLVTLPLAGAFGGGTQGFLLTALGFAAVASIMFPLVFIVTREPAMPAAGPVRFKVLLSRLLCNAAFWRLNLGAMAFAISGTVLTKSVLYHFKYRFGEEQAGAEALAATGLAGLAVVPLWMLAARFIGRKGVWIAASAVGLTGLGLFALWPEPGIRTTMALLVGIHAGFLGLFFAFWSLLPDTLDSAQTRADGFAFGVAGMISKMSMGVGAGLFGLIMSLAGYRANEAQSETTLTVLKALMWGFPMIGLLVCAGLFLLPGQIRLGKTRT